MKLLSQNSKMKKSKVRTFNFGIPALKDNKGRFTCPKASKCAIGCYANSGAYLFSNVARVYQWRLEQTLSDNFVIQMVSEIRQTKAQRIRIHDSGDFYLTDKYGKLNAIQQANTHTHYLDRWISIMRLCPGVEFYAYTKNVSLFKQYEKARAFPYNFKYIFSFGGKEDHIINKAVDRHALVFPDKKSIPKEYIDASDDDSKALTSNIRIALVYHGNKSYNKTSWSKVKG